MLGDQSDREVQNAAMYCHETDHYVFHCDEGGKAAQDIEHIASVQEAIYQHITAMLGFSMNEKIHYYLYDSREALGKECERRFGEYAPNNGCAVSENEILAVYNETIQCIGAHEDTHILMFTLGYPESRFLEEGVAMAMDALWWGIDNNAWTSYYRNNDLCPSVSKLIAMTREEFYTLQDKIAYPLAGSFVSYLLMRFERAQFYEFYMAKDYEAAARGVLGVSLTEIEQEFFRFIDLLSYDKVLLDRIAELFRE